MKKRRTAQAGLFIQCVLIGLVVFFVGLLSAMFATSATGRTRRGEINPQMPIRTDTRHLDPRVYPTGVTPTPTATPCASIGSWTEQSPYLIAVSGNAVSSQGGNVYSFGGIANNVAVASAYKYTLATNTWTPIASLPAPRGWFSAASDGTYIYLLGGVDQNFNTTATLWRYDPATNTYNTSLASYTIPTYFHASVYLNGKIYRIAGRAIGTDFHVEVYDIATNTWSMAANYPFANHSLMAAALGSFIYAGGGNASPDKTYRYDPGTNTWDDAAVADLPAGRSAAASGAYNGRWLLAGGDVNFAISTSAIAWDPATNTWSNLPNMVQARDYLGGATAGQSFCAVAGNSGPGTPTNDNQQYTETPCATPTPTPTPIACFLFENFDNVTPPALPPGWTAGNVIDPDGILWQTSNSGNPSPPADSPPNAAWINDPDTISDKHLDSPPIIIDQLENAGLTFRNNYGLQNTFDGGVLEVSIDGGPFQDILAAGGFFGQGGYNETISTCCGNPLAGRQAWTGSSGGFIETDVALPFQGHTIVLRWRMASDSGGSGQGWRVDTVQMFCERPTPTPTATSTTTPTATATATPTPTATATSMPCHVTSAACGGVITGTAPTDFIVNVSDPVDPTTVDPTDFTVNGTPANAFALQNGNMTIVFHFNTTPVTQGLNTMHIPAGAFNCVNGPVTEFTCTFTYKASTPTPTPTASLPPTPTPTSTARPSPTPRVAPTPRPRPTPPSRP